MSYEGNADTSVDIIKNIKFIKKKHRKKILTPVSTKSFENKNNFEEKQQKGKVKKLKKRRNNRKLSFKKTSCSISNQTFANINPKKESNKNLKETNIEKKKINHYFKRPSKIYEYGDNAEYKFIAFDKEEIPVIEEIITSDTDNNDTSTSEDEFLADNIPTEQFYNYKKYTSIWKELESGVKHDKFPLPVYSNSWNDLNGISILEFLKRHEILKKERIRWHPDRMKGILTSCNLWKLETEREITKIFQIINDLYQTT